MGEAWLLVVVLCGIVWLSIQAQGGHDRTDMHNRQSWMFLGLGLAEALWIAPIQLPAALLLVSVLGGIYWTGFVPLSQGGPFGLLRQRQASWHWTGYRVLVVAGAYGALIRLGQPWMVEPVLWTMVAGGVAMAGFSAAIVWLTRFDPFGDKRCRVQIPYTSWFIQDDEKQNRVRGGQGNPNHLDGLLALSIGAIFGLVWLGTEWVTWLLPIVAVPFFLHARPTQGVMHLSAVALAGIILLSGWIGWVIAIACVGGAAIYTKPWNPRVNWIDTGRFQMWKDALVLWWQETPWSVRLLGFGAGQWFKLAVKLPQPAAKSLVGLFTHAHNEYVHQTIEYGLIGIGLLLLYLGTTFWHLVTGGIEAQALWMVAVPLCSIAAVNFPWSFFQDVQNPGKTHDPWPRFFSTVEVAIAECQKWVLDREAWFYRDASHPLTEPLPVPQWQIGRTPQGDVIRLQRPTCEVLIQGAPTAFDLTRVSASLIVKDDLARLMLMDEEPLYVGSPGLVAWSVVIAVLAAVV